MDPTQANRLAWLDTIAWAEGANYNTLFGGSTFSDYSKHPLPARAIKLPDGSTTSAAGRYQFERNTWDGIKARVQQLTGLAGFVPKNQDVGALILTQQAGALGTIDGGNVGSIAVSSSIRNVWAGFKNKTASQVQAYFNQARAARLQGQAPGLPNVPAASSGPKTANPMQIDYSLNDAQKSILGGKADPQIKYALAGVVILIVLGAVLINAGIL